MLAYVSETARADRSLSSVTLVYAATPFGGAIASLISLGLAAGQWRVIFVVGGLVPLLVALAMMVYLSESVGFSRVDRSAPHGGFAAIFAGGRAVHTILLWMSFFLALLLLYLLLNWLPTLMVNNGLTRPQAAGAQIGFNIGGALASILIGRLLEGRLRNVSVLIVYIAVPVLLVALARAPPVVGVSVLIVFILGCAVVAAQAFLYAMATTAYPVAIRGVGVGMAVAVGRIGSIVGPKLGGVLKQAGHSPSQLFMDLLPLVILGSLCALSLAWLTRRPAATPG
jgi:AAHS family 3-hydroxyphenylpropionic acid transporter